MADRQKKQGEDGVPEPEERTEVTQASPADDAGVTRAEATAKQPSPSPAAEDAGGSSDAGGPSGSAPSRRRPSRLRSLLVGLLVLICCLAVVVTGVTLWAHYTVMNTDGYMKIVGPIGKDPKAIQSLSEYIGTQVIASTDLQQRISDALPPRARVFSGPITNYVEDFITKSSRKVLSSPKAYDLWLKINRAGHERVVALLRGESTNAYIQGSDVKLNVLPLISQVLVWVDERLPGALSSRTNPPVIDPSMSPEQGIQEVANWSGKPLPSDFGQITLVQSDALGPAQTAVKWFDRLVWILPLVTAALIAVTIWLARRRGRTAIAIGIGAAIAIFITRVIVLRASEYLTGQVQNGGHIVKDVVNGALGPLTTITVWICVIGVVAAILVWALGRRDVRAGAAALGRRAAGRSAEVHIPDSPVTSWIVNHVTAVRWGVLVVGLIVLALVTSSWLGIILTIVIEVLLQGVLSMIALQWPFAERGDGETQSA